MTGLGVSLSTPEHFLTVPSPPPPVSAPTTKTGNYWEEKEPLEGEGLYDAKEQ